MMDETNSPLPPAELDPATARADSMIKRLSPELEPDDGPPAAEPDKLSELPASWAPDDDEEIAPC